MLEFFKRKWKAETLSSEMRADGRVAAIRNALGLTDVSAQLLVNRGYETPEDARVFLEKRSEMLHDPFLMKDVKKGAERLISGAKNNERIVIYGDYDVDGVTSVSILYTYLK